MQAPQRQARPPEQPVATSKAPPPGIGPPLAPSNESEHSWPSEDDRTEREQREQRQRSRSRDRPTTIGAAPTAATSHHPHYHRSSQARPPQQGPQRRHRGLGRVGKTPCGHSLCFNPQQPPAAFPAAKPAPSSSSECARQLMEISGPHRVATEDLLPDLRELCNLLREGTRVFFGMQRAREWAQVHKGEDLATRAEEICDAMLQAVEEGTRKDEDTMDAAYDQLAEIEQLAQDSKMQPLPTNTLGETRARPGRTWRKQPAFCEKGTKQTSSTTTEAPARNLNYH